MDETSPLVFAVVGIGKAVLIAIVSPAIRAMLLGHSGIKQSFASHLPALGPTVLIEYRRLGRCWRSVWIDAGSFPRGLALSFAFVVVLGSVLVTEGLLARVTLEGKEDLGVAVFHLAVPADCLEVVVHSFRCCGSSLLGRFGGGSHNGRRCAYNRRRVLSNVSGCSECVHQAEAEGRSCQKTLGLDSQMIS